MKDTIDTLSEELEKDTDALSPSLMFPYNFFLAI